PPQPTPSNTQQAHPSTTKVVHQQTTQTTETTQTTASRRGHTLEHAKVAHQQATKRPKRRPATPPTPTNMLEHAHSQSHRHAPRPQGEHADETQRPQQTKQEHCGEAHTGEAGRLTPGQGARTGHSATLASASRSTRGIEHSWGTHQQHQRRTEL